MTDDKLLSFEEFKEKKALKPDDDTKCCKDLEKRLKKLEDRIEDCCDDNEVSIRATLQLRIYYNILLKAQENFCDH